uniref:Uncharacterized protein n=1 Tax=Trichuris muris TaxID=70415 RepID=A0A5S6QLG2_TRIMR
MFKSPTRPLTVAIRVNFRLWSPSRPIASAHPNGARSTQCIAVCILCILFAAFLAHLAAATCLYWPPEKEIRPSGRLRSLSVAVVVPEEDEEEENTKRSDDRTKTTLRSTSICCPSTLAAQTQLVTVIALTVWPICAHAYCALSNKQPCCVDLRRCERPAKGDTERESACAMAAEPLTCRRRTAICQSNTRLQRYSFGMMLALLK